MAKEDWNIDIHHAATQVIYPLPARLALALRDTIVGLRRNPRPPQYRPVEGLDDTYEVIVGFFRVVYQIQEEKRRIKVAMVNLRIE
jgi:mRNA-degrading endonuclease RelE of RelBE toxin-antitoxin system